MVLIKCFECKREISDKATACPNCWYPIDNKKKIHKIKEKDLPTEEKKQFNEELNVSIWPVIDEWQLINTLWWIIWITIIILWMTILLIDIKIIAWVMIILAWLLCVWKSYNKIKTTTKVKIPQTLRVVLILILLFFWSMISLTENNINTWDSITPIAINHETIAWEIEKNRIANEKLLITHETIAWEIEKNRIANEKLLKEKLEAETKAKAKAEAEAEAEAKAKAEWEQKYEAWKLKIEKKYENIARNWYTYEIEWKLFDNWFKLFDNWFSEASDGSTQPYSIYFGRDWDYSVYVCLQNAYALWRHYYIVSIDYPCKM